MAGAGFDAATYKETTRAQWPDAADAWHRWDPVFDRWLGEGTSLLLDRAAVTEGSRVLDVAAGSGGQTIEAARRVGASGAVLATDIASNILKQLVKRMAESRTVKFCHRHNSNIFRHRRAGEFVD